MNYYNEFDPHAAAWLRELIARKLIPDGTVDERSITEIHASDLSSFVQCHFFAGIGGWSLALQLAEIDPSRPLWTGSCPCQPYSAAGKGLGDADPRNLWPAFFGLIRECRPELVFGEQVADAIGKGWLDRVSADLEGEGYACGAAVLGAHSVGAPHIRKRLYWVAESQSEQSHGTGDAGRGWGKPPDSGDVRRLANSNRIGGEAGISGSIEREERITGEPDNCRDQQPGGMADADRLHDDRAGSGASDDSRERQSGELRGVEDTSGGMGDAQGRGLGIVGDASRPGSGGHAYGSGGSPCGMADSDGRDACSEREQRGGEQRREPGDGGGGHWDRSYWLLCRDGKHRRVPTEPALFPLADGLPYKLARRGSIRPALLKGAGNAIVPQVAAEFIQARIAAIE